MDKCLGFLQVVISSNGGEVARARAKQLLRQWFCELAALRGPLFLARRVVVWKVQIFTRHSPQVRMGRGAAAAVVACQRRRGQRLVPEGASAAFDEGLVAQARRLPAEEQDEALSDVPIYSTSPRRVSRGCFAKRKLAALSVPGGRPQRLTPLTTALKSIPRARPNAIFDTPYTYSGPTSDPDPGKTQPQNGKAHIDDSLSSLLQGLTGTCFSTHISPKCFSTNTVWCFTDRTEEIPWQQARVSGVFKKASQAKPF